MDIIIGNKRHTLQNETLTTKGKKPKIEFQYSEELFLLNGFYLNDKGEMYYCQFDSLEVTKDFKHKMTLRCLDAV